MENAKEILTKLLKSHDWWYMMSDDPRVYNKGDKEEQAINLLKKEVGEEEWKKLYNQHSPKEFHINEELDENFNDDYICYDAGSEVIEIEKYDPEIDWHNDDDVYRGTKKQCERKAKNMEEDSWRFRNNMSHKSYGLDESKEESGLWVYVRGREETNKIKEIIDNSDYYGEYDSEAGGFFFPETENNYDKLEEELNELFEKNGGQSFRFEGVFGLNETKQDEVFKELIPTKHNFIKHYGKDAEKVMYGRAKNLSKVNELKSYIKEEIQNIKELGNNYDFYIKSIIL